MQIAPDKPNFLETYASGAPQVVWSRVSADLETTVSAYLKLANGKPNSFILESVEGGETRGRYSFVGINPDLIWRCRGNAAEINRNAGDTSSVFSPESGDALDSLRGLISESQIDDMPPGLPPMASSLVGYMGYDMVRLMERLPNEPEDDLGLPDGMFVRPTIMVVFDTAGDTISIVTPTRPADGVDGETAYAAAVARIEETLNCLNAPLKNAESIIDGAPTVPAEVTSNMSKAAFMESVETCKEYIRAGDAFQIVPSQRFQTPFAKPPFALYRALR
ncbi:MAG: anthranilate synthase component I, partial [Alphaproteobacteria bacterium]